MHRVVDLSEAAQLLGRVPISLTVLFPLGLLPDHFVQGAFDRNMYEFQSLNWLTDTQVR